MKKVADIDLGHFHRRHGIALVPNPDRQSLPPNWASPR
jgi:hypothetical protein